jgi:hypothetical protein
MTPSRLYFESPIPPFYDVADVVAEWLRRQTANLLCSARMSSNLIHVDINGQVNVKCYILIFKGIDTFSSFN